MTRLSMLSAAALLLAATATPALAQTALGGADAARDRAVKTDVELSSTEFLPLAVQANLFELESSRLALTKTADPQVRGFAEKMIADHTQAGAALSQAAATAGYGGQLPTALDTDHAGKVSSLQNETGAEFDAAYLEAQGMAHEGAIQLFANCANSCDDAPAIKSFATTTLPVLQQHAVHLQAIQSGAHPAMQGMMRMQPKPE